MVRIRIGIDIGERTTSLAAIEVSDDALLQRHTLAIMHWVQYDARSCTAIMKEGGYSTTDMSPAESNEALTKNLVWLLKNDAILNTLISDAESVHVTIEQQLPNAMSNRILSHVVQAWFVMHSVPVEFQHGSRSAAVRILCDDPPCEYAVKLESKLISTNDYRRKKATTVRDARRLLICAPHHESWLHFFDTFRHDGKKNDDKIEKKKKSIQLPENADLADALLHALSGELTHRNLPLIWPIDNAPTTMKAKKRSIVTTTCNKKNRRPKRKVTDNEAGQAYFASVSAIE